MSKTKAEIRDRAANELGLLRLGGSLTNQDSTRITDAYEEVYERLKKLGLATWSSTARVPGELVTYMIWLVAHNCLGTYGVSLERYQRIIQNAGDDGDKALSNIRELVSPKYESQDEPEDY